MANLLEPRWTSLDTHDLRLLLDERVGGPGQYDGDDLHLYIPLARDSCKLVLTYCGPEIVELSPGPRFSEEEWQRLVLDIDRLVQPEPHRVGREFCFSSYRVTGSWFGARSGVHIYPPPPGTPEAPYEMADHPFVLEFPISWFGLHRIDNSRRIRTHRRLTLLLNLLLSGHTSFQSTRNQHLWAVVDRSFETKWVQASFFGPLGEIFLDTPSASLSHRHSRTPC